MGFEEASRYCRACDTRVLARRKAPMHLIHFLMSIITGGLWLVIWFLACCFKAAWRCTRCGRKI